MSVIWRTLEWLGVKLNIHMTYILDFTGLYESTDRFKLNKNFTPTYDRFIGDEWIGVKVSEADLKSPV